MDPGVILDAAERAGELSAVSALVALLLGSWVLFGFVGSRLWNALRDETKARIEDAKATATLVGDLAEAVNEQNRWLARQPIIEGQLHRIEAKLER